MTVHEGSQEQAMYYITERSPRQMLKSISTYKKSLAARNSDDFQAAYQLTQRLSEVKELEGPKGTLLSLPTKQQHNKPPERILLKFEVRRDITIVYGGAEAHAEIAYRTAERLDELADRFKE
jgi:hypothetical protein